MISNLKAGASVRRVLALLLVLATSLVLMSPASAQGRSYLRTNDVLKADQYLVAKSKAYFAIMQSDGNFCIYKGSAPTDNQGYVWCARNQPLPTGPYFAIMQGDGNFCTYKGTGPTDNRGYVWCKGPLAGGAPYFAVMGGDGTLAVKRGVAPIVMTAVAGGGQTMPRDFLTHFSQAAAAFAPFAVRVEDADGKAMPGLPVTWTGVCAQEMVCDYDNPSMIPPILSTTDGQGYSILGLNVGYGLVVTRADGALTVSAAAGDGRVDFNNTVGPLLRPRNVLTVAGGNSQRVRRVAGVALFAPLTVRLTDPSGLPLGGVRIAFACVWSKPDIACQLQENAAIAWAVTDAQGKAVLNQQGGNSAKTVGVSDFLVSASTADNSTQAVFTLHSND